MSKFVLVLFLLIPIISNAESWVLLSKEESPPTQIGSIKIAGSTAENYIDSDSVSASDGITYLTEKTLHKSYDPNIGVTWILGTWAVNCKERSTAPVIITVKLSPSDEPSTEEYPKEKRRFSSNTQIEKNILKWGVCSPSFIAKNKNDLEEKNKAQQAIDRNSKLKIWQESNSPRWDRAVQVDDEIKNLPENRGLSLDQRFAKVVDIVEKEFSKEGSGRQERKDFNGGSQINPIPQDSSKPRTAEVSDGWTLLASYEDRQLSLNVSSIKKHGELYGYWQRTNYSADRKWRNGEVYRYVLTHFFINCQEGKIGADSFVYRNSNHDVVISLPAESHKLELNAIVPDSVGSKVEEIVCSSRRPGESNISGRTSAEPVLESTGSGIAVNKVGAVLTNMHVVDGCSSLRIRDYLRGSYEARVVAVDSLNDLALLKTVQLTSFTPALFRVGREVDAGESVSVLGFPLRGILSSDVNVSFGFISATSGLGDDTGKFQISAPVQPGNSGGPLLDKSGNVIGVVVQKLNALKIAQLNGDIPQNVNFAIKGDIAQIFLKSHEIDFQTATSKKHLENTDVAKLGKKFTMLVECYK